MELSGEFFWTRTTGSSYSNTILPTNCLADQSFFHMNRRIRIFYEVFADEDNVNAQSLNARGIALNLDPERFESTFLVSGRADPRLIEKSHIRFIRLPPRMSSLFVKLYLLCARNDILIYPNELFHTPLFSRLLNGRRKWVYPLEMPIDFVKEESPTTFRHLLQDLEEEPLRCSDHLLHGPGSEAGDRTSMSRRSFPWGSTRTSFHPWNGLRHPRSGSFLPDA